MRILIYLHHPAHFHLFKNVIASLKERHELIILATKKDILEDLLQRQGIEYINVLPDGRRDNKVSIALGLLKQDLRLLKVCVTQKPDILVGTSTEITHIGKLLGIPSLFVNEDDVEIIPLVGKLAYPFATRLLTPDVCSVGKFGSKAIKYASYHELAYLHPNHFVPDKKVAEQYFPADSPFFILRFAKLKAHHDNGVKGIDTAVARRLIGLLKKHGDVHITAERELESEFEPYRIAINPLHMHHVMAFANLYVGDSQTMAAEAAVLGIPFVRFNDFVGRIGYLKDLEENYSLGYGISASEPDRLIEKVEELLQMENRRQVFQDRRQVMLNDKIDYAKFLTWVVEDYPKSADTMRTNPEYQFNFK